MVVHSLNLSLVQVKVVLGDWGNSNRVVVVPDFLTQQVDNSVQGYNLTLEDVVVVGQGLLDLGLDPLDPILLLHVVVVEEEVELLL